MADETKRKKVVAQKRGIRKRATPTITSSTEQTGATQEAVALPKEAKAKSGKKKKSDLAPSRKKGIASAPETASSIIGPSYEEIRLRAYFISVHRCGLGVPGDETGDWVQAEAELRQEMALEPV